MGINFRRYNSTVRKAGQNSKLVWTNEMERVKPTIKRSRLNVEQIKPEVVKIAELDEYTFFVFIPQTLAGYDPHGNSYQVVREGDQVIEKMLPVGYRLIAWYGWGGCGWLAQASKIKELKQ